MYTNFIHMKLCQPSCGTTQSWETSNGVFLPITRFDKVWDLWEKVWKDSGCRIMDVTLPTATRHAACSPGQASLCLTAEDRFLFLLYPFFDWKINVHIREKKKQMHYNSLYKEVKSPSNSQTQALPLNASIIHPIVFLACVYMSFFPHQGEQSKLILPLAFFTQQKSFEIFPCNCIDICFILFSWVHNIPLFVPSCIYHSLINAHPGSL